MPTKGENHHVAPAVHQARAQLAETCVKEAKEKTASSTQNTPLSLPAGAMSHGNASQSASAAPGGASSSSIAGGLSSGLAARRKQHGLSVAINKPTMDKGEKVEASDGKNRITLTDSFAKHYNLGKEVMPSTNAGMDVLFAKRISDGADVVIKMRAKAESFVSKSEEQEWRRSTEMLLNLPASENIARVYEVLEDDRMYYIVMEKVDGMDLFEVLHSEGRLPLLQAKAIIRQLLQAVNDLHSRGCIHKDLKLENVMVDTSPKSPKSPTSPGSKPKPRRGTSTSTSSIPEEPASPTVKLIDFDTVELFSPKDRAKSVVGTDQYIAQEAYAGHYSPASDIFSCGVIAYRLISGKFPFKNAMFDDKPGENWVGSPKMKTIQDRLKHFTVDFSIAPWPAEPHARDLVRWMLDNNEKSRPTAKQCLEHGFFDFTGQTPALPQGPWGSRVSLKKS